MQKNFNIIKNIIRVVLVLLIFFVIFKGCRVILELIIINIENSFSMSNEFKNNLKSFANILQLLWLYFGYKGGAFIWNKTNHWIQSHQK